jgi:hypothetical protein
VHACAKRRQQALARDALEHAAVRVPVLARAQRKHRLEQQRGRRDPARAAGLARGDSPAAARLVDVSPEQRLQLPDAHAGGVEDEHGQPVAARKQPNHSLHVLGARRLDVPPLLARELDGQPIARRIRLNPSVIEHHRQHTHRLADRLLLQPGHMQIRDERHDGLGVDVGDSNVSEPRQDAAQGNSVRLQRSGRDIDPCGLPACRDLRDGRRRCVVREANVGNAHRRKLADHPRLVRDRLASCREGAGVPRRALWPPTRNITR